MVTASHNPPEDNGYKVYLGRGLGGIGGDGAQIVPPADGEIETAIRAVGPLAHVPLGEPARCSARTWWSPIWTVRSTCSTRGRSRPSTGPSCVVAYTAMHGVGTAVATEVFRRSGFEPPVPVPSQAEPDPAFPTVAFPNPEEPGAMDLVIGLAQQLEADIAIANDPDADRCAVAVPVPGKAMADAARGRGRRAARRPPDAARGPGAVRRDHRLLGHGRRDLRGPAACRTRRR